MGKHTKPTPTLWYVFDCTKPTGYLFRAPRFVAALFVKLSKGPYDYAPTEAGY